MTDTTAPASPAATEMALLPCAHCGGDAELVPMRLWADDENDPPVFCNVCHTSALNAAAWNRRTTPDLAALRAERDRLRDALERVQQWADAYPLEVFPEPDFKRAHEVLTAAGMTLDAISASNMRHSMKGVREIARAALAEGRADG